MLAISICASADPAVVINGTFLNVEPLSNVQYTAMVSGLPSGATNVACSWSFTGKASGNTESYVDGLGTPAISKVTVNSLQWANTPTSTNNKWIKVVVNYKVGGTAQPPFEKQEAIYVKYIGTPSSLNIAGTNYSNGGSRNVACGAAAIALSVPAVATEPTAAVTYYWTYPSGWSGPSSTSSPSASVTSNAGGGGTIKVEAKRNDGSTRTAIQVSITRPAVGAGISGIIGSPYICSGTSNYYLDNVPGGTSVSWSKSGNGINISGGSSGNSVNVSFFTNEQYNILTATIGDACGSTTKTREIRAGVFTTSGISASMTGPGDICPYSPSNNETYYSVSLIPSTYISSVSWQYSSNWQFGYSPSGNDFRLVPPNSGSGSAWIEVGLQNECGYSAVYRKTVYELPAGSCTGSFFAVYPNPASDFVTLSFEKIEAGSDLPAVMDLYAEKEGKKMKSFSRESLKVKDGKSVEFNVADLPRGTYYLHVFDERWNIKEPVKVRLVLE
nr:hypothetical protein [uncultured Dyadobacter sp.]